MATNRPWEYPFAPNVLGTRDQLRRKHNLISDYSWRADYVPWLVRAALAEFLGTTLIVFFGAAAVASIQGKSEGLTTGAALAGLFIDFVAVSTFSPISGAYFNPAVVLGYWFLRMNDGVTVIVLWIAQTLGSFAAAGLLALLLGGTGTGIGAPVLGTIFGKQVTWWSVFILETLLGAASFIVILYNYNLNFSPYPALVIGSFSGAIELAVRTAISIGPNVARWLGPAVISGTYKNWYVWVFPPFIGVVLLAVPVFLFDLWLRREQRTALRQREQQERRTKKYKKQVAPTHPPPPYPLEYKWS